MANPERYGQVPTKIICAYADYLRIRRVRACWHRAYGPRWYTAHRILAMPPIHMSALQKRMKRKLQGAQFRWINEELYTQESSASFSKFQSDPTLFDAVSTVWVVIALVAS